MLISNSNSFHTNRIQKELQHNFNKRSRLIDNAISRVSPSLNATEILLLQYLANQKQAIYLDRNSLSEQLNRCVNSISNAIISLTNLNILVFDYDFNHKAKKAYIRKKKFILNTNTKEWQIKHRTDYRLRENRFIGSLRAVCKNEMNTNFVLATTEISKANLLEHFEERKIKATYLHKHLPDFVKDAILQYGVVFLMEWIDSVSPQKFLEMSDEQLQNSFYQYGKAHDALVIRAQRIVYRTRHKTMADDYNELDYLQFKSLVSSHQEHLEIANHYRSVLYRNGQRIKNMATSAYHTENQTISVRKILLAQNLVPTEGKFPDFYTLKQRDISIPAIQSQWDLLNDSYPAYSIEYTPVQTFKGKTYIAKSYEYALAKAKDLLANGFVRVIDNKEKVDYLKTDVFQSAYVDQRQIHYIPKLETLSHVKSREECMAKGLTNIIRLWDCGAINDVDFEIGYQILVDESMSLPSHCNTAKFNPFSFIDEFSLNYKQKSKLKALGKYLCSNDVTISLELDGLLNHAPLHHRGAFKQDTYFAYLDNRFTPEIAKKLKNEQINGNRVLILDPFIHLSRIMEEISSRPLNSQDKPLEDNLPVQAFYSTKECDECNSALDKIYQENRQPLYKPDIPI